MKIVIFLKYLKNHKRGLRIIQGVYYLKIYFLQYIYQQENDSYKLILTFTILSNFYL